MDADRFLPVGVFTHLGGSVGVHAGLRTGDHAVGVDGAQAFQRALHAVGEGFVGEVLVGEQRVAAVGGNLDRIQDGAEGRFGNHGGVGVPVLADDFLVAGFAADIDDLGVGADPFVVGVDEDFTEAAGEGFVLFAVQGLVAKEDHAVVEQGLADFGDGCVGEVLREVDAADLGA